MSLFSCSGTALEFVAPGGLDCRGLSRSSLRLLYWHFLLDLSLKPDGGKAYLQGYLVANPSQHSTFEGTTWLQGEQTETEAPLGLTGSFRLEVPTIGAYRLEIALQDQVIRLDGIQI